MDIENLTIKQVRELSSAIGGVSAPPSHPFRVGDAWMIRTVTFTTVGRIVELTGLGLVLDQASWVASTGRFSEALEAGELDEVERRPDGCFVAFGAIVDADRWAHALPVPTK